MGKHFDQSVEALSGKSSVGDRLWRDLVPSETDHGAITLGDALVLILSGVLFIYTATRTFSVLRDGVATGNELLAVAGLWAFDIGAILWALVWIYGSSGYQDWITISLWFLDFAAAIVAALFDTIGTIRPANVNDRVSIAVLLGLVIGLNILSGFVYHFTSPGTRRRRNLRKAEAKIAKESDQAAMRLAEERMRGDAAGALLIQREELLTRRRQQVEQKLRQDVVERELRDRLDRAANLIPGGGIDLPGLSPSAAMQFGDGGQPPFAPPAGDGGQDGNDPGIEAPEEFGQDEAATGIGAVVGKIKEKLRPS